MLLTLKVLSQEGYDHQKLIIDTLARGANNTDKRICSRGKDKKIKLKEEVLNEFKLKESLCILGVSE